MASSSSVSKGLDFASDDILCSYDHLDPSLNGSNSDPYIGLGFNSSELEQEFQNNRVSRSSMYSAANGYNAAENEEFVLIVEKIMKKYADNLMRFMEGISSRLSQLELYCYNLDKSIGEMRSELTHDNEEAGSKLKVLEKHLQEVHRSIQILRDKQELVETQKELAKLQIAQKESSPRALDVRTTSSASEIRKNEDVSDTSNTQLALSLPNQISQQPTHPAIQQHPVAPPQSSAQAHSEHQSYYMPSNQLTNPQAHPHPSYLAADSQYEIAQIAPQAPPQPSQNQVNQSSNQQFPQYRPQWPRQITQPMQPPQQPPMQSPMQPPQQPPIQPPQQPPMQPLQQPHMQPLSQIRAPSPQPNIYPYMPSQPPSLHMKPGFPSAPSDGYPSGGPHPPISSAGTYMLYDSFDGSRSHQPSQLTHYSQNGYPLTNPPPQNLPPPGHSSLMVRNPGTGHQQLVHNHPYNELIDKLMSMGYRGDHVASVIQRLEESGQTVDFNAVLDRLNGHSSGIRQRSW